MLGLKNRISGLIGSQDFPIQHIQQDSSDKAEFLPFPLTEVSHQQSHYPCEDHSQVSALVPTALLDLFLQLVEGRAARILLADD